MIIFKTLLFLNLQLYLAQIANDFGDYDITLGSTCLNNYIKTHTIIFQQTFSNIPQVIISNIYQDVTKGTNEYIFQTTDITTICKIFEYQAFTITIQCTQSVTLYRLKMRWAAFDDDRIEVINSFSVNMVGQTSKTLTFSHSNSNPLQGFISLTSYGFSNTLQFTIQITSITDTSVTVNIVSTNTNMLSAGFQIVLGTQDVFTLSSVINTGSIYRTSVFYTDSTIILPTSKGILAFSGFSYTYSSQGLRLKAILTETSTTFEYSIQSWSSSELNYALFTYAIINRKNLQPLLLKKMRISEQRSNNLDSHQIKLSIEETNSIYTEQEAGTNNLYVDKTKQTLNIVVSFQCSPGKKITGSLLKTTGQTQAISQNCYGSMNLIQYYMTFYQKDKIFQNLQIDVSSSGFIISEIVYNFETTTYNVLTLSISNQ